MIQEIEEDVNGQWCYMGNQSQAGIFKYLVNELGGVRSSLELELSVVVRAVVISIPHKGEGFNDSVTCGAVPGFYLREFTHTRGVVYPMADTTSEG